MYVFLLVCLIFGHKLVSQLTYFTKVFINICGLTIFTTVIYLLRFLLHFHAIENLIKFFIFNSFEQAISSLISFFLSFEVIINEGISDFFRFQKQKQTAFGTIFALGADI